MRLAAAVLAALSAAPAVAGPFPDVLDTKAERLRVEGRIPGLALAVIRNGKFVHVAAFGKRDVEKRLPLNTSTVMYGASLTKLAFAYMVVQLADEGKIDLDRPIGDYLPKPLPDYEKYGDLKGDPRWEKLTARILLTHRSGFANFRFLEPDEKLRFHFEPGERYAYSGEGINLLQFVIENGIGLDVGKEMQARVFDRFGMTRTSMTWRDDFAADMTTGYDDAGKAEPHDARESVRAAGSMDTTVEDYAKFLAGLMRGEGLSAKGQADMLKAQAVIASQRQFPTLIPDPAAPTPKNLSAGLGYVQVSGPQGPVLVKGGHNEQTDNLAVCVFKRRDCLLLMTNSGVGQRIFPPLVETVLGETGMPWGWEYNPVLPVKPE